MAKLMVIGKVAQVEITRDPLHGNPTATCRLHPSVRAYGCGWSETYDDYDDLNDVVEYASDHADGVQ